jgi:hypothetical protein
MAGNLKRKELISGRLGDILSNLFIASACLKQYHDGAKSADDIRLTKAACETCFYIIEKSFANIFANLSNPFIRYGLRLVTFPLGFNKKPPKDKDVCNRWPYHRKNKSPRKLNILCFCAQKSTKK